MTPRQRQCLDFIAAHILANGYAPTYEEIGAFMGVTYATARQFVLELECEGYLKRIPRKTRGIVVLRTKPVRRRSKSSRYRGVSFDTHKTRWVAYIRVNGHTRYLYGGQSEIEAAQAYDAYVLNKGLNRPLNFEQRKSA